MKDEYFVYLCIAGFLDCDGDPTTPCDTFVFGNDPNNCGGCNTNCAGPCGAPQNPGALQCVGGSCLCTIQLP